MPPMPLMPNTVPDRSVLSFAGTKVALGQTAELRLKVAESYTAEPVSIPVTVVRGAPGPTLFVRPSLLPR